MSGHFLSGAEGALACAGIPVMERIIGTVIASVISCSYGKNNWHSYCKAPELRMIIKIKKKMRMKIKINKILKMKIILKNLRARQNENDYQ
jgi:hypothetical protein